MRVKACGIKTERDLETAVKAGVDAVGFLVGQVHTSHDFILASTAARLVKFLPPYVVPVIVTHLTAPDAILDIVEQTSILTIQLHGGSTAEEVAALRDNLGPAGKLIYAAHVLGMQVTPALEPYYDLVDAVLLDSMDRETGKVGGTGMTHNWDVSAGAAAASPVPLTLAGGLTPIMSPGQSAMSARLRWMPTAPSRDLTALSTSISALHLSETQKTQTEIILPAFS